jgi:hypothetical protein
MREGSTSFWKKVAKKPLASDARVAPGAARKDQKFFGSFFQKRTLTS